MLRAALNAPTVVLPKPDMDVAAVNGACRAAERALCIALLVLLNTRLPILNPPVPARFVARNIRIKIGPGEVFGLSRRRATVGIRACATI